MNTLTDHKEIIRHGQQYLRTRYDLLRLELLEKMGQIIALILLLFCSITLTLTACIYFSFALVNWLGTLMNSEIIAFCIVGCTFLIALLIIYLCREKLFLTPLIRQLSKILFKENEEYDINEQ